MSAVYILLRPAQQQRLREQGLLLPLDPDDVGDDGDPAGTVLPLSLDELNEIDGPDSGNGDCAGSPTGRA